MCLKHNTIYTTTFSTQSTERERERGIKNRGSQKDNVRRNKPKTASKDPHIDQGASVEYNNRIHSRFNNQVQLEKKRKKYNKVFLIRLKKLGQISSTSDLNSRLSLVESYPEFGTPLQLFHPLILACNLLPPKRKISNYIHFSLLTKTCIILRFQKTVGDHDFDYNINVYRIILILS